MIPLEGMASATFSPLRPLTYGEERGDALKVRRVVSKAGCALLGATLAWAASGEAQAVPLAGTWILDVEDVVTEGAFPEELVPDVGDQILIEYVVDSEGDQVPDPDTGVYETVPDFVLRFPAGEIALDLRLVINNSAITGYEILIAGGDRVPLDQFIPNPPSPLVQFGVTGQLNDTDALTSQGDAIPVGELDLSRFDRQSGGIRIELGTDQGLEEGERDSFLSFRARPIFVAHLPEPGAGALLLAVASLLGRRRQGLGGGAPRTPLARCNAAAWKRAAERRY